MLTKEEIKKFIEDNGIREYTRKIQKYPYKEGEFTTIYFLDKDNNGVAICPDRLEQPIENELYKQFNDLYYNAYRYDEK